MAQGGSKKGGSNLYGDSEAYLSSGDSITRFQEDLRAILIWGVDKFEKLEDVLKKSVDEDFAFRDTSSQYLIKEDLNKLKKKLNAQLELGLSLRDQGMKVEGFEIKDVENKIKMVQFAIEFSKKAIKEINQIAFEDDIEKIMLRFVAKSYPGEVYPPDHNSPPKVKEDCKEVEGYLRKIFDDPESRKNLRVIKEALEVQGKDFEISAFIELCKSMIPESDKGANVAQRSESDLASAKASSSSWKEEKLLKAGGSSTTEESVKERIESFSSIGSYYSWDTREEIFHAYLNPVDSVSSIEGGAKGPSNVEVYRDESVKTSKSLSSDTKGLLDLYMSPEQDTSSIGGEKKSSILLAEGTTTRESKKQQEVISDEPESPQTILEAGGISGPFSIQSPPELSSSKENVAAKK